jgi:hypothetical protein
MLGVEVLDALECDHGRFLSRGILPSSGTTESTGPSPTRISSKPKRGLTAPLRELQLPFLAILGRRDPFDAGEDFGEMVGGGEARIQRHLLQRGVGLDQSPLGALEA